MQKIPTVFVRDPDSPKRVLPIVHPDCRWVMAGEGVATRKYDGTCCMLDARGNWWARREVKPGKPDPAAWEPVAVDVVTGKRVGWVPMSTSSFARWHAEALFNYAVAYGEPQGAPGTYELCGPKVNGNPEHLDGHQLFAHANAEVFGVTIPGSSFEDVRHMIDMVAREGWEGIVWHHPDGRMAKLKVRDFPEASA